MKKQSQCKRILEYLKKGHSLTPLQALIKFDSMNLAQRVQDLENLGVRIKVRMIKTPSGKRIAQYRI